MRLHKRPTHRKKREKDGKIRRIVNCADTEAVYFILVNETQNEKKNCRICTFKVSAKLI